jgi:5S rRNA maturation endonuclease (ribonuclease M5)
MNAAQIAKALDARELSTGGWSAKCPAHEDKSPSLSIAEGTKGPVVHCHAGCEQVDVIKALRDRNLWPQADDGEIPTVQYQLGSIQKYWDYHDASGRHVMRVCRWDRKDEKDIRPITFQSGRWTWKQFETDRPLYRLPALLKDSSKRVLVVEGEKTADAAQKFFPGYIATTWAGGAKAVSKADWKVLANRDVTLVADNDEPGRRAMDAVAAILQTHGCTVRRADLSALTLPKGWDIADALGDQSFDLDALADAIENARPERTAPVPEASDDDRNRYQLVPARDLLTACAPPEYVIAGLLEQNIAAGIVGPPESGKSLVAINMAACVATGKDFHGRAVQQGLVVYLAGEGQNGIRRRLQAIEHRYRLGLADAPLFVSKAPASFLDPVEVLRVQEAINSAVNAFQQPLALLIVDTVIRYLAPGDDNKAQDMAAYLAAVDALRGEATAISCHHPGHGDATRARGSSNWRAGLDAEFSIANSGDVVTVTCQKMKDGDRPAPFSFRIEQAPTLAAREDGSPVMSVVIAPTDVVIARKPTGKNQKNLLAELERRYATGESVWTEKDLRLIAKALGMGKSSTITTIIGLRQLGFLTDTIGGCRLSHADAAGYGSSETVRKHNSAPVQGYGKVPVSLETVLPSRTSGPSPTHGAINQ